MLQNWEEGIIGVIFVTWSRYFFQLSHFKRVSKLEMMTRANLARDSATTILFASLTNVREFLKSVRFEGMDLEVTRMIMSSSRA